MTINELLIYSADKKAKGLYVSPGTVPFIRIGDETVYAGEEKVNMVGMTEMFTRVLEGKDNFKEEYNTYGSTNFAYSIPGVGRFHINLYKQRGTCALSAIPLSQDTPTFESEGYPEKLKEICSLSHGMVLVTGAIGTGKTEFLSSLIEEWNRHDIKNIITLEKPIKYLHNHNVSMITQREVGTDTPSYIAGIDDAIRTMPNILIIDDLNDYNTMKKGLEAAEAGILVVGLVHSKDITDTCHRIIMSMPDNEKMQATVQLEKNLRCVAYFIKGRAKRHYDVSFVNGDITIDSKADIKAKAADDPRSFVD